MAVQKRLTGEITSIMNVEKYLEIYSCWFSVNYILAAIKPGTPLTLGVYRQTR